MYISIEGMKDMKLLVIREIIQSTVHIRPVLSIMDDH